MEKMLNSVVPWWFNFDPYPCGSEASAVIAQGLATPPVAAAVPLADFEGRGAEARRRRLGEAATCQRCRAEMAMGRTSQSNH